MGGLFSPSKPQQPRTTVRTAQPKVLEPVRMPDPANPVEIEARRQSLSSRLRRSGRRSTILSQPSGGSGEYQGGPLGA